MNISRLVSCLTIGLTVVSLAGPVSAAQKKTAVPSMQPYTDAHAGLSFAFPEGWSKGDPNDISTYDPDVVAQVYTTNGSYSPEVDIYRMENDHPEKAAKDYIKGVNDAKKKNKRFIKTYPLTIQNKKIDGYLIYSDDDKKKFKQLYVVVPVAGAYYEVTYEVIYDTGTAKKAFALFDQSLSIGQTIIQSMKFSAPVEDATATYTNKDSGFTFTYPEKWIKKESSDFERSSNGALSLVTVDSPTGSVVVKDIGTEFGPLDRYYEYILAQYKSDASVNVLQAGPISHGQEKGYQLEFTITIDKAKSHFFDTLLSHNGSNYRVGYEAKEAGYNKYLNQVKKLVRSFQFIEPDYTLDTGYTDKKTGATLRYPSALKLNEAVGTTIFSSAPFGMSVVYEGGFETDSKLATLDQYTTDTVKRWTDQGDTNIQHSLTTLGGVPAVRFTATTVLNKSTVMVYALKEGKGYFFILNAPDEKTRDTFLPMFDQMVSSFSFPY